MQKHFSEFASDVLTVFAAWPIYLFLREQGSLIWKPDIKPTFKLPSRREVDLQSYRAVGGVFLLYKDQGWTQNSNFSFSQFKFSAMPAQYIRNIYWVRFFLQARSAWPELTVQASYPSGSQQLRSVKFNLHFAFLDRLKVLGEDICLVLSFCLAYQNKLHYLNPYKSNCHLPFQPFFAAEEQTCSVSTLCNGWQGFIWLVQIPSVQAI